MKWQLQENLIPVNSSSLLPLNHEEISTNTSTSTSIPGLKPPNNTKGFCDFFFFLSEFFPFSF